MISSDEEWLAITDTFLSAAMDGDWYNSLEQLARATGSWSGELIGIGSASAVPFNWVTGIGPEWADDFVVSGGADLQLNPYARAAFRIQELQVVQSGELLTPEEWRSNSFINFHINRYDIRHVCLTPLIKSDDGLMVGLAVMRSTSQGEISKSQRQVFSSLAIHLRAAVRMQMVLENQGAMIMANALEAMSIAAFICDRWGSVKTMTAAAETLVSSGRTIQLRHGRLRTSCSTETRELNQAITDIMRDRVCGSSPTSSIIPIKNGGTLPLLLEILPVPIREHTLGFEPRVLVVVRGLKPEPARVKGLLRLLYNLTVAETDVALLLADGLSPETIAISRQTSTGTVRVQIRAIYVKLGVRRQSELAQRINQLF